LNDRNKRNERRMSLLGGNRPVVVEFPVLEIDEIIETVLDLFDRFGHTPDRPCADDEINPRALLKQSFAFELSNTPEDADHRLVTAFLPYLTYPGVELLLRLL